MEKSIENPIDFAEELYKKVKTTMQARYFASAFYEIREQYSIASQGFLSAYIIIINFIPAELLAQSLISFMTIALSILTLVLSQIESHRGYKLLASRLHNCAKELRILETELQRIICNKELQSLEKEKCLDKVLTNYNEILTKYQENHNHVSYQKVLTVIDKNSFNFLTRQFIGMKYIFMPRLMYILLIFIPPIAFFTFLLSR